MAQVTYRGVKYDTETQKATEARKVEETYRGIKLLKELATAANQVVFTYPLF